MESYQPQHPLLRPYVKNIYYTSLLANDLSSLTLVPTGNLFLGLLWGNREYIIQRPEETVYAKSGNAIISGPQIEMGCLGAREGQVNIIIFELTPSAIFQFFGIPQHDMTNQVLQLDELGEFNECQMAEQAASGADALSKISIIERFLCQKILNRDWEEDSCTRELFHLINQSKGNITINSLSKALRVSTRTIERKFRYAAGIPPKTYCRVIQFNHAFRQLVFCQQQILDVVYERGYYDQAHFDHHFKKVMGLCPSRFFDEQEILIQSLKGQMGQASVNYLSNTLSGIQKLYIY